VWKANWTFVGRIQETRFCWRKTKKDSRRAWLREILLQGNVL